ncbi:MAG TPA: ATP-dependent sacrificial sulfur transferase LarE [Actinomycetales bacterium]|nr:ATP-dependent sacrificial sulfur transferase LarE [Actinomycetales bacterium]
MTHLAPTALEPGRPGSPPATEPAPLTVGFDLDMTLVDSRAGIVATMQAALAELGQHISEEQVWRGIGTPLEQALAPFLPADDLPRAVARYRELYPTTGVRGITVLPGAAEALAAVRALHGRVAVVSTKVEPAVRLVLDAVGLEADVVAGGLFGGDKGLALAEHGVSVYVGDHVGDVAGARAAGAASVAVTTGPQDGDTLRAAGADVVLTSLTDLPAWLDEHVLDQRLAVLDQQLRDLGSVVVAFSGGADSAMLLAAAVRALGPEKVVAATAVSPSLAGGELEQARDFALGLGVRHVTPRTDEMSREGYQANAGDRCFFCKAELLDVVGPMAAELGFAAVATGTNADDVLAGFRPGIRAAAERGAVTPLRDAGLTKAQVRAASRRWGLVTSDKPAAACLSSRIAFGVRITQRGLDRVDRAEHAARAALAEAGVDVRDLRVRDLGDDHARLEIDRPALAEVTDRDLGGGLVAAIEACGFTSAEVDPRGFRSGSMNELLATPERYR